MELTILMPCLNEAETLGKCIVKGQMFLKASGISGEILVADNGSTDGSQEIAESYNKPDGEGEVRIIEVKTRGYGSALIAGIQAARGKYVIMGDADDSYNFLNLQPFMDELRKGADLVMGNRFAGGIAKGAMPFLHRYFGNPALSFIGRLFFHSKIGDFHCGLRGFKRESILALNLQTSGMEFASEMIVKAALNKLRIVEVPATLDKDGRSRPPHLRTWHDGWRHLKFLLMYSPDWLFVYPGIVLLITGLTGYMLLLRERFLVVHDFGFGAQTLVFMSAFILVGCNLLLFSMFTKVYAVTHKYLPGNQINKFYNKFSIDLFILIGILLFIAGFALSVFIVIIWHEKIELFSDISKMLRFSLTSMLLMVIGLEIFFSGFFIGILRIRNISRGYGTENE